MKSTNKIYIFVLLCFFQIFNSKAQSIQAGIGIGRSVYWGDLNSPEFSTNINNNGGLALQLFLKKNYNGRVAAKASLTTGKLRGNDKLSKEEWQRQRNLDFSSNFTELAFTGEYYFFGFDPSSDESFFSPYVTAGIAGFYFNPTTVYNGIRYELQPLGTEGQGSPGYAKKYNKVALSLPFGAGGILKLRRGIDFTLDIIARRAFTDYIDDVSGVYVNYNQLKSTNGEMAAILADRSSEYFGLNEPTIRQNGDQRGGRFVTDWYFTALAGITISLTDSDSRPARKRRTKTYCPKF